MMGEHSAAQHKMENKIWIIITFILSTLFGVGLAEVTDDKIQIPIIEKPAEACAPIEYTGAVLAYTDNEK